MKKLRFLLSGGLICGLLSAYVAYRMQYCPNYFDLTKETQQWWRDVFLNFGTGLIGSVTIIFLYDWQIRSQSEKQRRNRECLVKDNLRTLIIGLFNILFCMYYTATTKKQEFASLSDIFGSKYFDEVVLLDLNKSPFDREPWYEIINDRFTLLHRELEDILIKDREYLEPNVIRALDELRLSSFIDQAKSMPSYMRYSNDIKGQVLGKLFPKASNGLLEHYNDLFVNTLWIYVRGFQQVVETYNNWVLEDQIDFVENPWEFVNWTQIGKCRVKR